MKSKEMYHICFHTDLALSQYKKRCFEIMEYLSLCPLFFTSRLQDTDGNYVVLTHMCLKRLNYRTLI
jgi:hypothetical protein